MVQSKAKNINAAIDSEVAEKFYSQIDERGQKIFRAVEGALRLWLTLSSEDQTRWIEGKATPVFSTDPSENEIYAELDQLARNFASVNAKIRRSEAARKKSRKSRPAAG